VTPCNTPRTPPRLTPLTGSRYRKRFVESLFIKKNYRKSKIKKLHPTSSLHCIARPAKQDAQLRRLEGAFAMHPVDCHGNNNHRSRLILKASTLNQIIYQYFLLLQRTVAYPIIPRKLRIPLFRICLPLSGFGYVYTLPEIYVPVMHSELHNLTRALINLDLLIKCLKRCPPLRLGV
jgi:hypothetical protein